MYIIVQFGNRETRVLNPNCKCHLLLNTLRQECHFPQNVDLELSDELGNVKSFSSNLERYAVELVAERERLVLLRVDKRDGDNNYTPLLEDDQVVNDSFLARLQSRQSGGVSGTRPKSQRVRISASGSTSSEKKSVPSTPKVANVATTGPKAARTTSNSTGRQKTKQN